jgi:AcrR family transcriptional regulator
LFIFLTIALSLNASANKQVLINMPKVVPEYKEEAKERIIQAALKVFSEKGYHQATMEHVATRLGVSRGALYQYFKSKEELLYAIIERWDQSMKNFLPPAYEGKEPKESLQVMFEHIAEDSPGQMGFILELIAEASRDPSIKKLLLEAYQRSLKTTTEFLAKQSKKNVAYSAEDVRRLSVGFMMLQLGLLASLALGTHKTDAKLAWQQLTKAIVNV